jgi:AcrR family transcriptional regulator
MSTCPRAERLMSATVTTTMVVMARWEPDSRGRLEQAALALYSERGFESTTVAEIAERAGLTERTFFRHYADKREVLFSGGNEFQDRIVTAVRDAPASAGPMEAAGAGLDAAAEMLQQRRPFAQQRQRIIASSAELRERELIKLDSLTSAVVDALRRRGVAAPAASLTGEVAIAVFRSAFGRWVDESNDCDLPSIMRESLDELAAVATR